MGRYALLLVMALSVSYTISSVNLNGLLTRGVENSVEDYSKTTAKNLSRSMTSILKDQLSNNTAWRETTPVSATLFDGNMTYTIKDTVLDSDSLVKIEVNTSYHEYEHESITFVRVPSANNKIDKFLEYSVIANGDVIFSGCDAYIRDHNNTDWNANINSNKTTTWSGVNGLVEGFVTYNISNSFPSGNVIPNNNPDGDPNIQQVDTVAMPYIVPSDYLSLADEVYSSDKTFTGTLTLGTPTDPKIIYVQGKLNIQATVSGYGIFIVENDIIVTGNMSVTDVETDKIVILSAGDLICSSASGRLYAHVVINGNFIDSNADLDLYGTVAARGVVNINNSTLDLFYRPMVAELATPVGFISGGGGGGTAPGRVETVWVYE